MRNLKKVLSLSLAFVMLLGMMVIGAGAVTDIADFNDQAEISDTYREAVDLLTAIEVLEGSNGAFNPAGTLTREQAAKIVATVALGVDAAEALNTTVAPFSDVAATRWSAGYIAYCANMGIINGVGGGRFNPTGEVTGYQFAKMLLGVLGYGVNDEYVGSKWTLNVSHDARVVQLDYHVVIDNDPATREEAAQLAYNALRTPLVTWSTLHGTYTSFTTTNGTTELLGNIATNIFRVRTVDFADDLGYGFEYWRYIDRVGAITADYPTDDIVATVTGGSAGAAYRANVWNDTFQIWENGRPISAGNSTTPGTYVFGVTADGTNDKALELTAGSYYDRSTNATYYGFLAESLKGATGNMVGYNGQKVDLIDTNEDGAIDKVVVITGYLAEVTKVKPESPAAGRSVDVKVYVPNTAGTVSASFETEDYEKGDYIMVYPTNTTLDELVDADNADELKGSFRAIVASEKCEVVTAAVSAYYVVTNKDGAGDFTGIKVLDQAGSVGVSGLRRNYNGVFHTGKDVTLSNGVALGQNLAVNGYNLNNATYAFYLDSVGNVAGVKVVDDSIGNYAYITRYGHDMFNRNIIVEAILADGTIGTYTISLNSGKNYESNAGNAGVGEIDIISNINAIGVGRIYAYSLDGSTITLTALPKVGLSYAGQDAGKYNNPATVANNDTITQFVKGGTTITYSGGIAYATDETVFIYYDGSRVTRYVGKNNAPDISTTNGVSGSKVAIATERVGTTTYATLVVITSAPAVSNNEHLYITRGQYFGWSTDLKGSPIYYYEAILNGKQVNVAAKQNVLSVGVHTYSFDPEAFTGGEVEGYTIESGVYNCDSGERIGANTVKGVVKVRSNNDVVVVSNTARVTGKDTSITGGDIDVVINGAAMWSVAARDAVETLNLGDEVTIVYSKQGSLYIAKSVYVTKAATVATADTLKDILDAAKNGDVVTIYTPITSSSTAVEVPTGVTLYVAGGVDMTKVTNNGTVVAESITAGTISGTVVITKDVENTISVGADAKLTVEGNVKGTVNAASDAKIVIEKDVTATAHVTVGVSSTKLGGNPGGASDVTVGGIQYAPITVSNATGDYNDGYGSENGSLGGRVYATVADGMVVAPGFNIPNPGIAVSASDGPILFNTTKAVVGSALTLTIYKDGAVVAQAQQPGNKVEVAKTTMIITTTPANRCYGYVDTAAFQFDGTWDWDVGGNMNSGTYQYVLSTGETLAPTEDGAVTPSANVIQRGEFTITAAP